MSKDAMQKALEAMERYQVKRQDFDRFADEITALKKALANEALDKKAENAKSLGLDYEPAQQEPVAWIDEFGNVFPLGAQRGPKHLNEPMKPLYTTPPQRPWVGLTDKEVEEVWKRVACYDLNPARFASAIEAALRSKNT